MKKIFALTKRNCLLFLRSKATFFFSLFSSLVMIVLYFLFIAKLYAQGFNEAAGIELTSNQLYFAIYSQMIMGVLVINSVSLAIGVFTFMAQDLEKRKVDAFLLAKIKPSSLILSYLFSSIVISFAINFLTFALSVIIIGAATTFWIGAGTFFYLVGALIVITLISCAVMLLITILVRTSAAIGVINGIMGTILGFLCGIYMPYTNLGSAAKYVGSCLPFTHMTIWMKQIVLNDVFGQFGMSAETGEVMKDMWFSAGNVGFVGLNIPLWGMLLMSAIFAVACLAVAVLLLRKRMLVPKIKIAKRKDGSAKN